MISCAISSRTCWRYSLKVSNSLMRARISSLVPSKVSALVIAAFFSSGLVSSANMMP